ncbi:MAG TPA: hypothetical protein VIO94_04265 [Phenylobacterium sp.]
MSRTLQFVLAIGFLVLLAAGLIGAMYAVDAFEGLGPIWGWVAGGAVVVGVLAAVLMWLAFFSSKRGYDDIDRRP